MLEKIIEKTPSPPAKDEMHAVVVGAVPDVLDDLQLLREELGILN